MLQLIIAFAFSFSINAEQKIEMLQRGDDGESYYFIGTEYQIKINNKLFYITIE